MEQHLPPETHLPLWVIINLFAFMGAVSGIVFLQYIFYTMSIVSLGLLILINSKKAWKQAVEWWHKLNGE